MITVSGTSLVWPLGSGTYYVKVYATEPFRASDGTFVVGGKTGTANTAIDAVLCTFVSASPATGTLTIPDIELYATDTSRDRPDVRYNAVIHDSNDDYVQDLLLNFYVPADTATTTWAELEGLVSNPDPPVISSITPTKLTATLVWSAPTSLYAISGYEVRFNGSVTDVGNVLTYQKTGLTASTNYTFEVRARDVLNHLSPWSEVEDARTLSNDVPTTPVLNAADVLDYTVVAISWSAATDTDGTVSGYHYRLNGGSPVDVGNYLEHEIIGLTSNTAYSIQVRAYDNLGATGSWSNTVIATTEAATNPIIVGHGDSMMFGSGNEATVPETDNPSIQTKNLLTGATWEHTNLGVPGAKYAHAGGSPDDLILGATATVDPLYDSTALHNILITNGGINNVTFAPATTLAANYPWLLQRLKTFYIEYGEARKTTGWGPFAHGCIVSPMPVCDFPNTPSDYESYLRTPFNAWLAANWWSLAAEYADWTGNANIGNGANTNNATYFDVSDPDSGGTADRLHLTTAGYAIEAQYFRDAIERITKDVSAPVGPTAVSVTALNCEQIRVNYTNSVDAHLHHYEIRVNGGAYTDEIIDIGRDNPYVLKNLAGSTAYEIEIRATDVAGHHSVWSSVYTATTTAGTFTRLYAIDCGRTSGGTVSGWLQDTLFTNGTAYDFPNAPFTARTFLVDDPATNAVYQKARISNSVDPVTYTFSSVNTSHHHRVRMHFVMGNVTHVAEPVADQWLMDIEVNNVLIEDDFDLSMEIGVGEVVYVLEYEVAAGASSVVVELTQVVPGVAQIAAIELYGVAP
jgi:hypothetical protein